jgi:hypothetical protein
MSPVVVSGSCIVVVVVSSAGPVTVATGLEFIPSEVVGVGGSVVELDTSLGGN